MVDNYDKQCINLVHDMEQALLDHFSGIFFCSISILCRTYYESTSSNRHAVSQTVINSRNTDQMGVLKDNNLDRFQTLFYQQYWSTTINLMRIYSHNALLVLAEKGSRIVSAILASHFDTTQSSIQKNHIEGYCSCTNTDKAIATLGNATQKGYCNQF